MDGLTADELAFIELLKLRTEEGYENWDWG